MTPSADLVRQCYAVGGALEQLSSHALVEEFRNRHIIRESLSPSSFHEKIPREAMGRARFQGMQDDTLIQWIARDNGPVIEHGVDHCLTLGESPKIGLESKTIEYGKEGFDAVQGRSGDRLVLHNVPPAFRQYRLDCTDNVPRTLDLETIPGLHEPRGGR